MPLENATTINQLDSQWPAGGDTADKGDDHIRLIKSVLKQTFPGPAPGNGFDTPVTVDPKLLNELATKLTAMETAIKNAHPIGDVILRLDNTDPGTIWPGTTWQRVTADACIAPANAAGTNTGSTSGTNNPAVPLVKHNHSATISNHDGHNHGGNVGKGGASFEHHQYNSRMPCEAWQNGTDFGGAHGHTATIGDAGVDNATIDVRGARLYVSIWKRVA